MIVAEYFGFVVGIDTHAKTHTLAIIDTASGGEIANETFPATATGGNRALSWILRRTSASPKQVLLSMEGKGSYGAKLRRGTAVYPVWFVVSNERLPIPPSFMSLTRKASTSTALHFGSYARSSKVRMMRISPGRSGLEVISKSYVRPLTNIEASKP